MSHLWLAVLCLVLMAAFIIAEYREKWTAGVALKGAASLCFVILGILGSRGAADTRFAGFVVAGLAVGAVADVLLNLRYVYKKWDKLIFAAGTLVFLVGHVLYSIAVWPRAAIPWLFVIIGAVATFFIMRWIFSKIDAPGAHQSACPSTPATPTITPGCSSATRTGWYGVVNFASMGSVPAGMSKLHRSPMRPAAAWMFCCSMAFFTSKIESPRPLRRTGLSHTRIAYCRFEHSTSATPSSTWKSWIIGPWVA